MQLQEINSAGPSFYSFMAQRFSANSMRAEAEALFKLRWLVLPLFVT